MKSSPGLLQLRINVANSCFLVSAFFVNFSAQFRPVTVSIRLCFFLFPHLSVLLRCHVLYPLKVALECSKIIKPIS